MLRQKIILLLAALMTSASLSAQGTVRGRALDRRSNGPLPFVTVKVTTPGGSFVKGAVTDDAGRFVIDGLNIGQYRVELSLIGYKTISREFSLTDKKLRHTYQALYMSGDLRQLDEVTVTGQRTEMRLEVDRKTFTVDQTIANAGGSAAEVLENIPSVEIDQDGAVSLRGNSSVEVWINGKASGLTSDNRGDILQQLPAESIEKVEVIDNPSSKYSAEGTAGIINIVLKKKHKAGYYGSLQTGGNTNGGYNASGNINYSSSLVDAYANLSYRHREDRGGAWSRQTYYGDPDTYQNYDSGNDHRGSNLFTRLGATIHATQRDDFSAGFMGMFGNHENTSDIPYLYGVIIDGTAQEASKIMFRHSGSSGDMRMLHGDMGYKHSFSDNHFLEISVDYGNWSMDDKNIYQDSITSDDGFRTLYQYRPQFIRNNRWEVKIDYEREINERWKAQAGYNGDFSHENTPQESWVDSSSYTGLNAIEDETYFNRFIYNQDTHALYAIVTFKAGRFGVQGGLRAEYWKVYTESYSWAEEHDASLRDEPFKKDYFSLFPSLFLSYELSRGQSIQLNYTRRLRRPWGGMLNSFKNTRDATVISYGNPELTPEYTNSFSLNYMKTFSEHTLSLSAYWRPSSDVMQRVTYTGSGDGMLYQTNMNVAKSLRTGVETVVKNRFWRVLDLTSTINIYYYRLDAFSFFIDNQRVTGDAEHSFTWSARVMASLILPYDISLQTTWNYRSREAESQGYRKPNWGVNAGLRKTFFNKKLALSVNCRDLFETRRWENITETDTFRRHQKNWRSGRRVGLTLTWNFGNMTGKRKQEQQEEQQESDSFGGYEN